MKGQLVKAYFAGVRVYRRLIYALRYARQDIRIDPSSFVSGKSRIRVQGGGSIEIGKGCEIHDYAMILTYGGTIRFGDHCSLNPFSIIYGHGGVRIGDGVRIAAHTVVVPGNHNQTVDGEPMHTAGTTMKGIEIADHVWLGAGVRILDGVNIGQNAVVGAGSVVTRSVPANTTVGGVPARVIKQR